MAKAAWLAVLALPSVEAFGFRNLQFGATPAEPCEVLPQDPRPDFMRSGEGCRSQVAANYTSGRNVGGTLYVFDSKNGSKAWHRMVNLANSAIAAGCVPKAKPHMVLPNAAASLAATSYTSDTWVHIMDAASKEIVTCLDATNPAPGVEGGSIHTGSWTQGDGAFIMVDMTGSVNGVTGGALHKYTIDADAKSGTFVSSLGLGSTAAARGTSGTKPIAMGTNMLGQWSNRFFVTDAKGAGSIVDVDTMTVIANLPLSDFGRCTSGGLWVEPHPSNPAIVVAQYGSQDPEDSTAATRTAECLVAISLENLAVERVYQLPAAADDAHGLGFCVSASEVFLVNTNRVSKTLDIINYDTGNVVVDSLALNAILPAEVSSKYQLMPDVIYLRDGKLYVAGRGHTPLSAVKPYNFLPNATSGMFTFSISSDCSTVSYDEASDMVLPSQKMFNTQSSDFHGLWGVGADEIWAICQSATGSIQSYDVFSACAAYGDQLSSDAGAMG
jgi:hypothetical protein